MSHSALGILPSSTLLSTITSLVMTQSDLVSCAHYIIQFKLLLGVSLSHVLNVRPLDIMVDHSSSHPAQSRCSQISTNQLHAVHLYVWLIYSCFSNFLIVVYWLPTSSLRPVSTHGFDQNTLYSSTFSKHSSIHRVVWLGINYFWRIRPPLVINLVSRLGS
jgi:hypothetical protein